MSGGKVAKRRILARAGQASDEAEAAPKGPHGKHHQKIHNSHHEEGEEGEPWLLSYADMVTLLMCFFILFFSMDKSKGGISNPERLEKRLMFALGLDPSAIPGAPTTDQTSGSGSGPGSGSGGQEVMAKAQKALGTDLYKVSKELRLVFALAQPDPETLSLTFLNSNFFAPGSADLTTEAENALAGVAERLKALDRRALTIQVAGHTDGSPVTSGLFPSNWELSSARAAAVIRFLIGRGLPAAMFEARGYADQKPVMAERDANGALDVTAQRLNRRVEIRLKAKSLPAALPPAPPPHASKNSK